MNKNKSRPVRKSYTFCSAKFEILGSTDDLALAKREAKAAGGYVKDRIGRVVYRTAAFTSNGVGRN